MATLTAQEFYTKINNNLDSVYFFYGDEVYLIEDAVRRVHHKIFGSFELKPSENLSLEVFYGSERPVEKIIDSAQSLGFFSTQKMLLIKESNCFKDKDFTRLQTLMDSSFDGTTIVFILEGTLPRNKFYKSLADKAHTVQFKTPYEREFPNWILYLTKNYNISVDRQVPHLLLQLVGPNLLALDNEIRKLAISLAPKNRIEEEDVFKWIAASREESVFTLANAFGDKDSSRSLSLVRRLVQQGQTTIGIVTILARHLRILFEIKLSQSSNAQSLSNQLGIPTFFMKDYLRQSTKWTPEELAHKLQGLRQTEIDMKSTSLSPTLLLERVLV